LTSMDVAGRAAATSRLRSMSSSCRCSPPSLAVPAYSGRRRRGSVPESCPRSRSCTLSDRPSRALGPSSGLRLAPWPPSSPSAPPMRCPGSGLRRSRRLSTSKPSARPAGRRGRGVPTSGRGGNPASAARAACSRAKCRDAVISAPTKAPEGPNLVAPGGVFLGSFRGLQLRTLCATSGDAFRISSG
jgi:hypothetical protein